MSAIRFFGVGKSRLQLGSPLQILLMIESLSKNGESSRRSIRCAIEAAEPVSVPPTTRIEPLLYRDMALSEPSGIIEIYGAELDTSSLAPGAYEISLTDDPWVSSVDETVWIMTPADWKQLLSEEIDSSVESFSNLFRLGKSPDLNRKGVEALVNGIFSEAFEGSFLVDRQPALSPTITVEYQNVSDGYPIKGDPLSYMTTVIAEECRNLAFWGVHELKVTLTISKNGVGIGVLSTLSEPLSPLLSKAYTTPDMNELLTLQKLMLERFDGRTEVSFRADLITFSISWSMEAANYSAVHA